MLNRLYIKNYTLIEELTIDFRQGFSVITGETGAGKSIILGALALIAGQRADARQIKPGADKCTIEAHFDLSRYRLKPFFDTHDIEYDEADCILRREVVASGKSRAFINDTPVQLTLMRQLGEQLIDIHSQHENQLLNQENYQLGILDRFADHHAQLEEYRASFATYHEAKETVRNIKREIEESRKEEDFLRFQFNELNDAKLQADEQAQLEEENRIMGHAEEIQEALNDADARLSTEEGGLDSLKQAIRSIRRVSSYYPKLEELSSRMDGLYIDLKDIAYELDAEKSQIDYDPERQKEVEERLDLIYRLQQKYRATSIAELLQTQQEIEEKLVSIDTGDERLQQATESCRRLEEQCRNMAARLTADRTRAAKEVEAKMKKMLAVLGIPNAQFDIAFQAKEPGADGADHVEFLFSANRNMPLSPISQVASGGEIARVMLSLKAMIGKVIQLPTIIFDEIDTGVSGKIAEKMAQIMQEMGTGHRQVISITHLPQIAAMGSVHYKVMKKDTAQGTVSQMSRLSEEERINEIAQMLSGSEVTKAAIDNAKELLKQV